MTKAVTPVLTTDTAYVDSFSQQVATLLRFMVMNPGWTSSLVEQDMLSFRKLAAEYEGDRLAFASQLKIRFLARLNAMFPNKDFDISFTPSDYEKDTPDGRYTVAVSVIVNDDKEKIPVLISGEIVVDPKTNEIIINYSNNSNASA